MNKIASLRGAGLLLVAATAWGGLFPVALMTLRAVDPFHMTAIRYGITALIFVGLLALAEGPRALRAEGRGLRVAALGSAGFAGLGILVFVGLQYSRPEHGAIIMATQPLIGAVMAWFLRGVRPARATVAFLGIALLGVLLVVTKGRIQGLFDGGTGVGDLLMLLGAISWVIYTLGGADFPTWSPLRYTALTCVLSLPAIFGVMTIATATGYVSTPSVADVESVGWQLAYVVGISSVLAVLCWNAGNKLVGATNGMLFINFVPVTVFAIRIAQGHHFQPIEFVGAALVIGALIGNNILARRSQAAQPSVPASKLAPAAAQAPRVAGAANQAAVSRPTTPARRTLPIDARAVRPEGCG
jgi:drug/metabolite transporter (DMT)-like permease